MSATDYIEEISVGGAAVRWAMDVCKRIQAELLPADAVAKSDASPVTVADFASQALICGALARSFPQDPVVGEESADALRRDPNLCERVTRYVHPSADQVCAWIDRGTGEPARRFWTVDPVDGTKGFLRREQYAIAVALIVDGRVAVGILGCPNLPAPDGSGRSGCLFLAERGRGTFLARGNDAVPLRVSDESLRFAESYEPMHGDAAAQEAIARRAGLTEAPIRIDSQAKYALVARGEAGALLRLPHPADPERRENIWDHAAGSILVEEAGGVVTDVEGRPLDFGRGKRLSANRGLLAAAPALHERLLKALQDRQEARTP